ncbi:MAG TPA: tetraacyldisaccharide 4'-kinase [Acidobacteriaceae bacterium]|nr:tetraacyldisaccharide 4'-kinase [Acidobacteriaceae bacterium]
MTIRRSWALPLVPLYWAALRTKDALRASGLLPIRRLVWPVVSIGSLSAGGAGKTPVVIALADLLRSHGHNVDVLSRGYGRQGSEVARVDLTAPETVARFGDEPVLIASLAGVPVWVGSERHTAGLAAEQASAPGIHLLDDGFQHRRLARAFDVVLLTAEDLDDALLPVGNRREPLSALHRADAVVLREEERGQIEPRIRRYLRPGTPVWLIRRSLHLSELPADAALLAFSGIARPQGFLDMLKSCSLRVIDSVAFPDHHRYTAHDMRRLAQRLQSRGAQAFITTEKDAVKITPELRTTLEAAAPMHVAQLRVAFADPARVLADLEARCS